MEATNLLMKWEARVGVGVCVAPLDLSGALGWETWQGDAGCRRK